MNLSMKMMLRTSLAACLALAGLVLLSPTVRAADGAKADRRAQSKQRAAKVVEELELTQEQKTQLRPILKEQAEKWRELIQDKSGAKADKLAKAKEIWEALLPKLQPILKPEQFEQLKTMRENLRLNWLKKQVKGKLAKPAR